MANGLKFGGSIMKELYKIYLKDSKKSFIATENTTHYDGNKILPQPFALSIVQYLRTCAAAQTCRKQISKAAAIHA